jgi:hypothetical protein
MLGFCGVLGYDTGTFETVINIPSTPDKYCVAVERQKAPFEVKTAARLSAYSLCYLPLVSLWLSHHHHIHGISNGYVAGNDGCRFAKTHMSVVRRSVSIARYR